MKNGSGGHGHRLAAPPVRTWLRRRPIAEVRCRPAGERLTLPWLLIPPCSSGWGWGLDGNEGRGKMEARVAVDPPATGSGSTRSSDGDAMGANLTPDTCDDGGTLDPLPLDLHPSSVGLCGLLRCRWVSRANPRSPLQLGGFAARAMLVCGVVDPVGSCRGPRHLHPDTQAMGLQ